MQIRIYYEDTDMGGIVYHANYLKFCERARSELFFSQGLSPAFEDGHFVVRHIEADFKASAILGDIIEVKSEVLSIGGASLRIKQDIFRNNTHLFSMTGKYAYVKKGKPAKISDKAKEKMTKIF
ncbi:MAG: YbgC/FadM family acyl-CoA thioesterase [Campylobacterales bacterium]|nr:YbgC/FadM family acyl-CoA thioesterase [Campylobacterales bacterium]